MQATGVRLGAFLQSLANIGTALVIGFYYGWKLTFLILGFGPFIAVGGYMEFRLMSGSVGKSDSAVEKSGKVCSFHFKNVFIST